MATLDEVVGAAEIEQESVIVDNLDMQQEQQAGFDFTVLTDLFKRETGAGSIDDYIDHPLNFKQSAGLAQVIRGITGIIGDGMGVWWIDVIFGTFKMRTEAIKVD